MNSKTAKLLSKYAATLGVSDNRGMKQKLKLIWKSKTDRERAVFRKMMKAKTA
jgi:hypothetical protein